MANTVSVIIPVYNVGKYIIKTIDSLINQSFKDFELILVNDGSKDNSIELAEERLSGTDLNYRVINKVNEGVSKARNVGINESKGKYIYFLDADDYIDDTLLEKMYNCAEKENAQVVFCGYTHLNAQGEYKPGAVNTLLKVHKYLDKPIGGLEAAGKMLRNEFWISAISGFYDSSFLKGNKILFPENIKFGEDTIFAIKALMHAKLVASVNEPLVYYVRRETSVSKNADEKYFHLHESNLEILRYNEENFKDKAVESALLEYKIPHSIIRIFSSLAKSGRSKEELFKFIKDKKVKSYLRGFKINGDKDNIKFKIAASNILMVPHVTYRLFNLKGKLK
ncbi:glycosyltransferase [Clostridium sp.]|uniref:glycosyltransferase family 2 protein n=1 Tax=Clostridium sp. TaxID=1506 RepID=UPI002FC5E8FC